MTIIDLECFFSNTSPDRFASTLPDAGLLALLEGLQAVKTSLAS